VLGCDVYGRRKEWFLAYDAGDVSDHARFLAGYEMRYCKLGHADGMCDVNI